MSDNEIKLILDNINQLSIEVNKFRTELREADNKGHKDIYIAIDNLRREILNRVDELEDKTFNTIKEIELECRERKDIYMRSKKFLDHHNMSQDEWWNSKVGKFFIVLFSAITLFSITRAIEKVLFK